MPPALGSAAPAVVVVDVNTASLVAMSIPSTVELVVNAPVKTPPDKFNLVSSSACVAISLATFAAVIVPSDIL